MATPLDRSLTYRLHLLHKVSDYDSHQSYLSTLGLALSEARCLTAIGSFQPMSVMALADKGNLNKGQASRAAQVLVDKGWVVKKEHPTDGRGVELCLTPAGQKLWKKAMDLVEKRNQEIFGCLSPKELATLSDLLDRLVAHNVPT
ncbi:MAG: MarR family winged helix-turn-helix transcriptional regulator [Pseudomonadota bacterium]